MSIDRLRGFLLIIFLYCAISRSVCAQDQRPELFLQLPHQGEVLDADFSPKGGYATAGQDGTVRIWSGESGLLSAILEAHPLGAMACRFDPSGNFLATGGVDGHVKIWETGNYRLVRDFATKHEIHSVEWSGDGKILAALDVLEEAFLWDASSGSLLSGNGNPVIYEKDHPDHQVYPFYDLRHHLAFAPDNEHLLVAKRDGYALEVVAPPGSSAWNVPQIFPASISSSPNTNRIAITRMSDFLIYDGALSKVIAGVLDGTKVLKAVSCAEVEDLIRQHKVSGGMILKLEACKRALSAGVSQVRIVGGTNERGLLSAANGQKGPGTRVTATYPAGAGVGN